MGRTIAEVSAETLKLQAYVEKLPDGTELSFHRIAHDTKLAMDETNKQHLRAAINRCKREYSSIRGYGIKLAESKDALPILTHRLTKIDKAVLRGEKSQKRLQERFIHSLNAEEQRQLLFAGAVFGAIRVAAQNGRLIYQKSDPKAIAGKINIPIVEKKD